MSDSTMPSLPPVLPNAEPRPSLLQNTLSTERYFLKGRHTRGENLESAVRIFFEFIRGFESLDFPGPSVTVFGSARFKEGHPLYAQARQLGTRLAQEGFSVMTGGGPGLMEAANRGAQEGGGHSVGCTILLPHEEPNPYLDRHAQFDHFFVRKVMLIKYSSAFVIMPGGFGTMDEFFEILTLIQTGKVERFPVIALGADFWDEWEDFVAKRLVHMGTVSPGDLSLVTVTNSVEETIDAIKRSLRGLANGKS
jgi:uncharacterized protein (TIGR00730 family)